MCKQRIGISVGKYFPASPELLINTIADIGFDAISPVWQADDCLPITVNTARARGLTVQSLHAPDRIAADIWQIDNAVSQNALDIYMRVLQDCHHLSVPIMVVHSWGGFNMTAVPGEKGLFNFAKLVDKATEYGIRIAFENLQGEQFLYALLTNFQNNPTVGLCWDSGHELCYNRSKPILADWGDRLLLTHLNDNLGITSKDGSLCSKDDLHLLPYDGTDDWDRNIRLLRQSARQDILNFEVKPVSKPGQKTNYYGHLPLEQYLKEACLRAKKVAHMYAEQTD